MVDRRNTRTGRRPSDRTGIDSSEDGRQTARQTPGLRRCPRRATCASCRRCSSGPDGALRAPMRSTAGRYLFCSEPCRWIFVSKRPAPLRRPQERGRSHRRRRGAGEDHRSPRVDGARRRPSRPARTSGVGSIRGGSIPSRRRSGAAVRIYLFGYSQRRLLVRVIVTPTMARWRNWPISSSPGD